MLSHHKKTLIKLFGLCHKICANPRETIQECLYVQETLIQKITYIERQIRKHKKAIKVLKNQLGNHDGVRFNKDEANKAKTRIEQYHYRIDEYQKLATIYRDVGDAIAFSYIDKWDIKPLAIKETAGSLSGKKGSRLERKVLRAAFAIGHIALLNDITNCLRYGDITVPKDGKFMIIELKSGKQRTSRDSRQFSEIQKVVSFLQTDKTDRLYGQDRSTKRVGFREKEIHHRDEIDELVFTACDSGISTKEVENGLFYIVSTHFVPEIATNVLNKCIGQPLISLLNQSSRYHAYFPIILTIQNPEFLFKFYEGKIAIITILDTGIVGRKLSKYNLKFRLIRDDDEWFAEILENDTPVLKIGSFLWLRLQAEFISLDWFVNELIQVIKLQSSIVQ